mgnify:CR=1 FL=1
MAIKIKKIKAHNQKKVKTKLKYKILILTFIYIALLVLAVLFNFEQKIVNFVIDYILIPCLVSAIIAGIFGIFLDKISGDFFKQFFIHINFWKIKFKLNLFFVIVFIITIWVKWRFGV